MRTIDLEEADIFKIIKTQSLRIKLAYENIEYFFGIYFSHHFKYELAPFHKDFLKIAGDDSIPLSVILAFRGSAKSTIFSLCYPIWAITGRQKKKFILIITQTQEQAKKILDNIKRLLEDNELLKADIGPFVEDSEEWSAMSISFKKFNARIMVASTEQSIRGLLYKENRPDIVILDDIENLASVRTEEERDKLFNWYLGEVIPLGDIHTRHIFLGTRLHRDDILSRLVDEIKVKKRDGIYRSIPIVKGSKIAWPGKYPDMEAVLTEKKKVGDRITWEREYLLNILSSDDQIIKPNWIFYYDDLPLLTTLSYIVVGIDPAVKKDLSADFTAMIVVYVFGKGQDQQYYVVLPIINKHLTPNEILVTAHQLCISLPAGQKVFFVVEDTGTQGMLVSDLIPLGVPAEGPKVHGQSKDIRLSIVSSLFEQLKVHFKKSDQGSEKLVNQLLDFGTGHDDMVDALVYALLKAKEEGNRPNWLEAMKEGWIDTPTENL